MMSNKSQALSNVTPRQKVIGVIFALIVLVVLWQVIGMFHSSAPTPVAGDMKAKQALNGHGPGSLPPTQVMPQQLISPKQESATSQREMELIKLQQETEAKYLAALNELQMLKVEHGIADENKAIMSAKLDAITSEKGIVSLLTGGSSSQGDYSQNLENPTPAASTQTAAQQTPASPPAPVVGGGSYTVISVSMLQHRWSAVLGFQGNLYSVSIGDILPPDGSTVVSISKSGVVLSKNGDKTKVSLVPII